MRHWRDVAGGAHPTQPTRLLRRHRAAPSVPAGVTSGSPTPSPQRRRPGRGHASRRTTVGSRHGARRRCPRRPRLARGERRPGGTGRARSLTGTDILRLILDDSIVETRIARKTTTITVPAAVDVCPRGRAVLRAIRRPCGESKAPGSALAGDLDALRLRKPASSSPPARSPRRARGSCDAVLHRAQA
jgi:hypothetical protein